MKIPTLPSLLIVGANLAAGALVAATAMLSAPAFASGFGPAASYDPLVGAPASQRGESTLSVNAEEHVANVRYAASTRTETARPNDHRAELVGMNEPILGRVKN